MTTLRTNGMKLFAKWEHGKDPGWDDPTEIRWGDGQRATLADYVRHLDDTFLVTVQNGSFIRIVFLDVAADVRFDEDLGRWVCEAPGQLRVILELADQNIGDDEIIAALYTYPVVYRAVIHRRGSPIPSRGPSAMIPKKEGAVGLTGGMEKEFSQYPYLLQNAGINNHDQP